MPRYLPLAQLENPHWVLQVLYDTGSTALDEPASLSFSLLPRRRGLPEVEKAHLGLRWRTRWWRLTSQPGAWSIARQDSLANWHILEMQASPIRLKSAWHLWGHIMLRIRFALHDTIPWMAWDLIVTNLEDKPLRLTHYTALAVGPLRPLRRASRLDLSPARLRLFRLSLPPTEQSAYYNMTERFGALRVSEKPCPLQATWATERPAPLPLHDLFPHTAPPTRFVTGTLMPTSPSAPYALRFAFAASTLPWEVNPHAEAPGLRYTVRPYAHIAPQAHWRAPLALLGAVRNVT